VCYIRTQQRIDSTAMLPSYVWIDPLSKRLTYLCWGGLPSRRVRLHTLPEAFVEVSLLF